MTTTIFKLKTVTIHLQLQKMIEENEKRDQTKYGSVVAELKRAKESALKSKTVNEKKALEIVAAFESSKDDTNKTKPSDESSFALALIPRVATELIIITSLLLYHIRIFPTVE